jgi:hypothetical protein
MCWQLKLLATYLIGSKVSFGLIRGTPLPKPDSRQLVNSHFVDDSLTISEDQTSWAHTMECLDTFCLCSIEFEHSMG